MTIAELIQRLRILGMVGVIERETGEEGIFWAPQEQPSGLVHISYCTPVKAFPTLFPTVADLVADTTKGFQPLVNLLREKGIIL